MSELTPVVGDWYKRPGGNLFEVVAVDDEDGTIEVQHYDGTLEEYESENWAELAIEAVEPPEDWLGSVDMDREDLGLDEYREGRSGTLSDFLDSVD